MKQKTIPYKVSYTSNNDVCAYCDSDINLTIMEIVTSIGIHYCHEHFPFAKRDCSAYLHREELVTFDIANQHPILKKFINTIPPRFSVLRSSGILEDGWKLNLSEVFFTKCKEDKYNDWIIPVINGKKEIKKHISIFDFIGTVPESFVNDVVSVLNYGIMKNYSDEYDGIVG